MWTRLTPKRSKVKLSTLVPKLYLGTHYAAKLCLVPHYSFSISAAGGETGLVLQEHSIWSPKDSRSLAGTPVAWNRERTPNLTRI
jgi:hypothetical protein